MKNNLFNPLCKCGCGQKVKKFKNIYIKGHYNKNRKIELQTKLKCSSKNKERRKNETTEDRKKYTPKKLNKYTIEYIRDKYKIFSKIEEMRYNNENKLQVKCKKCQQWFFPKNTALTSRIYALEKENGNDGCYLYCSKECKNKCVVYHSHSSNINNKNLAELMILRNYVLKRDNYICQYCENKAEVVHHTRPQKIEPFFSLDPDYAISVCRECHIKYSHRGECSFHELATKVCS
jgi:hypothetical protein